MNPLQKCKDHSSLQFYRCRSNRFGKNGLTDACRAVFPKQAAPKSHAVLVCHESLSPSMRSGELRGGLSSRPPGAESLKHRRQPRRSRPTLFQMKLERSTEFPLRRLAVRGCERTMSGAERRAPMRSSGAAECQGDCGAIEPTKPPTGMKRRLSIFEVALAIASAQRNLRSGFPYCSYKERQPAGSIGLCGGSYCRRLSSPRLGQDSRQCAGEPYHPRAGYFRLRGMLMAADGRATVDCKSAALRT